MASAVYASRGLFPGLQDMMDAAAFDRPIIANPKQNRLAELNSTWTSVAILSPDADWVESAFNEVSQLKNLAADWSPLVDAAPPNDRSIHDARRTLQELARIGLKPSYVHASVEEGVCIAFRNGERYADIECFNDGEIIAATSDGRGRYQAWEIDLDRNILSSLLNIQNHLGTPR